MRNLQHYWGFTRFFLLETVSLEEMVVIKTVAFVFIKVFFSSENEYLTVRLVMWRLPESEEAWFRLTCSLDLLLWLGDLWPLELHVN